MSKILVNNKVNIEVKITTRDQIRDTKKLFKVNEPKDKGDSQQPPSPNPSLFEALDNNI